MRRLTASLLGLGLLVAGGASVYTLRASGSPDCPPLDKLQTPVTEFRQEPDYYTHVTLRNPNDCYGFENEPVEITLYGPHGRRAISYFQQEDGTGPVHGDVGICCSVTLPPHGTWTIRLGHEINDKGSNHIRICRVSLRMMRSVGLQVWKRMPDGGNITGRGTFPPGWKDTAKPLPDNPALREPCDTASPSPS